MSNPTPTQVADVLLSAQCNMNMMLFTEVFTDNSDHLWPKWVRCDGNILNFMTLLDPQNKSKLINWSVKKYLERK